MKKRIQEKAVRNLRFGQCLLTLGVAFLLGAGVLTAQTVQKDYALTTTKYDFQEVPLGQNRECTFGIVNRGRKPLVLLDARTGCQCTKVEFSHKPLHPGDTTTVRVFFEAREVGVFTKKIFIRNSSPHGEIVFQIQGTVTR